MKPQTPLDVYAQTSTPDTYGSTPDVRAPAIQRRLAALEQLEEAEKHGELGQLLGEFADVPAIAWSNHMRDHLARDHVYFVGRRQRDAETEAALRDDLAELRATAKALHVERDDLQRQLVDEIGEEEAYRRRWHRLELGTDCGGPRWFLVSDGYREPINTGTPLILQVAGGGALPVRFEVNGDTPELYLAAGDDHEIGGVDYTGPTLKILAPDGWRRINLRLLRGGQ